MAKTRTETERARQALQGKAVRYERLYTDKRKGGRRLKVWGVPGDQVDLAARALESAFSSPRSVRCLESRGGTWSVSVTYECGGCPLHPEGTVPLFELLDQADRLLREKRNRLARLRLSLTVDALKAPIDLDRVDEDRYEAYPRNEDESSLEAVLQRLSVVLEDELA